MPSQPTAVPGWHGVFVFAKTSVQACSVEIAMVSVCHLRSYPKVETLNGTEVRSFLWLARAFLMSISPKIPLQGMKVLSVFGATRTNPVTVCPWEVHVSGLPNVTGQGLPIHAAVLQEHVVRLGVVHSFMQCT